MIEDAQHAGSTPATSTIFKIKKIKKRDCFLVDYI
jgi:hypothetical protein